MVSKERRKIERRVLNLAWAAITVAICLLALVTAILASLRGQALQVSFILVCFASLLVLCFLRWFLKRTR